MQSILKYVRAALFFGAMLVIFAGLASIPASAQNRIVKLELRPSEARLVRLDRQAQTVIIGDKDIADVAVEGGQIVVLTARKVGTTNLIALDADRKEILNAWVIVAEPGKRVTVHAPKRNFPLQKFFVYRCPRHALCEFVSEPEPVVARNTIETLRGVSLVLAPSAAATQETPQIKSPNEI